MIRKQFLGLVMVFMVGCASMPVAPNLARNRKGILSDIVGGFIEPWQVKLRVTK